MKKFLAVLFIVAPLIASASWYNPSSWFKTESLVVGGAGDKTFVPTILPLSNNAWDIGTSTNGFRRLFLATSTAGCASFSSSGELYSVNAACGSGSGGGDGYGFVTDVFGGNTVQSTGTTLWLKDITQYGLIASTSLFQYSSTTYGSFVSASTTNLIVNGETVTDLTGTGLSITGGALGLTNSTISGIALGSNLGDLTAGNTSLTFSGTYNGSTARNIVLNVGNANTWTAKQNFFGAASSTLESANFAEFGGTATTTFLTDGRVGIGSTTPWANLAVNATAGIASNRFAVGSSTATSFLIDNSGAVLIGTTSKTMFSNRTPNTHIAGTTTIAGYLQAGTAVNPLSFIPNYMADFTGNIDGYAGWSFTNLSPGVNNSVDLLFDTGSSTETTYYSDFGFNSPNYNNTSYGILNVPNSSYWYNTDGPIQIATATTTANGYFSIITGGTTAFTTGTERFRITSNGFTGIGTSTPPWMLQIASTTASATFKPQLALTDTSAGANLKHWTLSSQGGNFYISSSSDVFATSTTAALSIGGTDKIVRFGNNTATCIALTGSAALCDGDDASSAGGGSDPFTHLLFGGVSAPNFYSATTSQMAISTSTAATNISALTVASSTASQLALSAGAGLSQWVQRNAGGKLYFATTTTAGTATSSQSALTIDDNGFVGIASTTPKVPLSVMGRASFGGNSNVSLATAGNIYVDGDNVILKTGGAFIGNSTAAGSGIDFDTVNQITGKDAASGNTSMAFTTRSLNAGIAYNFQYRDGAAGTQSAFAVLNLAGFVGFSTTTPSFATLTVATSTLPQLALSDQAGIAQWTFRNAGANLYISTTTVAGTATSTPFVSILNAGNFLIGTTTGNWYNSDLSIVGTTTIFGNWSNGRASTTAASTQTIDWSKTESNGVASNFKDIMLTGATTIVLNATSSNPIDGASYKLRICQDPTGSRAVTWATPGQLRWWNGTTTISSAANKCTFIGMVYTSTNGNSFYSIVASSTSLDIK